MVILILGFIVGALAVILVEVLVILYVIRKIIGPSKSAQIVGGPTTSHLNPLDPHQSIPSLCQKQGILWVLDPEQHPKISASTDLNKKRDIVEVSPIRKLAKVKDRVLILTETDGSVTKVILKGCKVVAVSATSLPTRKWAKRYPIKVENKYAAIYQGSKIFYIYAETSWEKESWCKALRIASSDDKERLDWFLKLTEDFRAYLKSLSDGYPSLIKPSSNYQLTHLDKATKFDDHPSKVRQFWRKLSRKTSVSSNDEKRVSDKSLVSQDHISFLSNTKSSLSGKIRNEGEEGSSLVSSFRSGNSTHGSENSDGENAEKFVDEGTLCWNLFVSRLFFDAKSNLDIRNSLKARIQRSLSTMRIPTYIGEVTCTDVDPGNLPPYIHSMRAVPTDMSDVWAMEMDIEYSGGVALFIETRLEVRELDSQNGTKDYNIKSTDLLEDFKHLQEDLEFLDDKNDSLEGKDSGDSKHEMLRSSSTSVPMASSGSRWKSLLNSVAKHVPQVPLNLTIRVATLRGTIQLHMKPPPSDQLWIGFTSMPDIQFQLESSVKDHKVTSGRVASFLINRFKASIRETLVLPNCESVGASWMLAEKDDWVPRNVAPLMWLNREAPTDSFSNETSRGKKIEDKDLENKHKKQKKSEPGKQPVNEDNSTQVTSSITTPLQRSSSESSVPIKDLKTPLLQNEEVRDSGIIIPRKQEDSECNSPSRYVSLREERSNVEDDDEKPKRVGRKARMFDLGKKMSEKFEEKRRHIEEKSRNIVEKMRGP